MKYKLKYYFQKNIIQILPRTDKIPLSKQLRIISNDLPTYADRHLSKTKLLNLGCLRSKNLHQPVSIDNLFSSHVYKLHPSQ